MDFASKTRFRTSALASGLVTAAQIEQAVAELQAISVPPLPETEIQDGQIAARLVQQGTLNRWQAEQLLAGRTKFTLGPYLVIDSIGQGGMGQVFKGVHKLMGRVVAVKVIPRDRCTPDAVANFTREIKAQATLDHENLVRAFDAGFADKVHYLVTEYVPGMDLRKYVRANGPLNMQQSATIISQVAKALEHAHSRGLIHRDVKPGNVLVTPDGRVKLSDLGLAAPLENLEDDPRSGKIVGTADYLSPEQISTPRQITPVTDMYSLGCTLYYAATGKVPFPGGTIKEKTRRHMQDTPLHPRLFNPHLSDEFIGVIWDLMEKDPRKRMQTPRMAITRLAIWAGDAVSVPPLPSSEAPPASFIAPATDGGPGLGDTMPALDEPSSGDFSQQDSSPSQISQSTEPVASATHETVPIKVDVVAETPRRERFAGLTTPVIVMFAAAGLLLTAVIIAALVKMILS